MLSKNKKAAQRWLLTETSVSEYNLIDGYKNTATHVKHATVIGSGNTVSGEEKDNVEGLILLGDNRNVWKQADHSVVIGSSDDTGHSYVTRPDTVIIGHNAYIEDHGAIRLAVVISLSVTIPLLKIMSIRAAA